MEFEDLLKALEEAFGIDGLVPDDRHMVDIDANGTPLTIFGEPESRMVALFAEIGDLPLESRGSFYELALRANWFVKTGGDVVVAINPETNVLTLNRVYPMDELDDVKFVELVYHFASAINVWRQLAVDWRGAQEEDDDEERWEILTDDEVPSEGDKSIVRVKLSKDPEHHGI